MDSVRQWVAGVCCAAVACSLLELLHPTGNMKKVAHFVTALFFLAALVLPASSIHLDLPQMTDDSASQAGALTQSIEELIKRQTAAAAQASIRSLAVETLSEIGVTPVGVSATVSAQTDGTYGLTRLVIRLKPDDRMYAATIRMRMRSQFELEPELVYEQNGGEESS